MLRYKTLKKKPKELLAATGLTAEEFEALLTEFAETYEASYAAERTVDGKPRQRRAGGGGKATLRAIEDKLLFILVYEKTYLVISHKWIHERKNHSEGTTSSL